MKRVLALAALCAFLGACTSKAPSTGAAPSGPTPPAAPGGEKPSIPTPPTTPSSPSPTGTAQEVKAIAEKSAAELKQAAAKTTDEAKQALKSVSPEEISQIAEPGTTVDKLKGMLANLNTQSVTAIADKLLAALKGQEGSVGGLKDELSKVGLDLTKAAALKDKISSTTSLIAGLKEKLKVTVDALKAGGGDVSKYTASISG